MISRKILKQKLQKHVLLTILLCIVLTTSIVTPIIYSLAINGGSNYNSLTVEIQPRDIKLYFGETQLFQVIIYNGTPPYEIEWQSNSTYVGSGITLDFSFEESCNFVILSVLVKDSLGAIGTDSVFVYDPLSFTTTIEEGSMVTEASYIIFRDGSTYYARNGKTGAIDYSGPDASTVIQTCIDNTPRDGLVIVKGNITINTTLFILRDIQYVHYGVATLNATYLQLGNATHHLTSYRITVSCIDGVDKTAGRHGIKIVNAVKGEIHFHGIKNCDKGIYFDSTGASVGCGENRIYGGSLAHCNVGIDFSNSTVWMQGNFVLASIFTCSITGIRWQKGGMSEFTFFVGVSDQALDTGTDVEDEVGEHVLLFYFIRTGSGHVHYSSFLINQEEFGGFQEWHDKRTYLRAGKYMYLCVNCYHDWDTDEDMRVNTTAPAMMVHLNPREDIFFEIYYADAGGNPIVWFKSFRLTRTGVIRFWQKVVNQPVAQGETTLVITLPTPEPDAVYGVSVTPRWNTTVWVTGKSVTGFTFHFGTAAPAGGSFIDYFIFR